MRTTTGFNRWLAGLAAVTAVAGLAGTFASAPAGARIAIRGPATTVPAGKYTWPKIDYNSANSGVSPDPTISTADAGNLGVNWMSSTGASTLSSPVAAYSTALHETLVYIGNEAGYLNAYAESTGKLVWSIFVGSAIRDTPLVENGNLWVSPTYDPSLYKINAATGAVECSAQGVSVDNADPTIGTPAGGKPTVYIAYMDQGTESGPLEAIDEATCSLDWEFTSFVTVTGSWDALSFATDGAGQSLVLLGTSDPDDRVYAVNALTGALVWDFQTQQIPGNTDIDVGAGVSVTAPGVNGFKDGMAYVTGKDGYAYGVDLTTGKIIWQYNFGTTLKGGTYWSRSTPAVVGSDLVFGETTGAYCLNAKTGTVVWQWNDGNNSGGYEVVSGIAAMGPPGKRVLAMATLAGTVDVVSLASGEVLYSYQTGGWSDSSAADANGHLIETSSDGYLYDFKLGGSNGTAPTTAISSPTGNNKVAYPGSTLKVTGTATAIGSDTISRVEVAIQSGGSTGPWWDGATQTWGPGFVANLAIINKPKSSLTGWNYSFPVPTIGGVYRVLASAVDPAGLADVSALGNPTVPSRVSFTVGHSPNAAVVYAASGIYVAPGATLTLDGSGFSPGETVDLSSVGTSLGSVTADSSGKIDSALVSIPTTAGFGPAELQATGQTSGDVADAPLDVSNSWNQSAFDSANTNDEVNDTVFAHHVSPTDLGYLEQAWSYPTGAALDATPAVANGVLYDANEAGTVTALNVHNSAPVWTTQESNAIDSSPALDAGMVFFGTKGGFVVAVDQSDGVQVWKATTSSAVEGSPTVIGGDVYVGTDNGRLYVLNEDTGAVVWSTQLGGAIVGPPAVDPANGVVAVGDASGALSALSISTGSVAWQFMTGGPITAGVTIYNREVMVGSGDGKVYARNEMTGTRLWSFATGGPIRGTGALHAQKVGSDPITYAVGSADGDLYYLGLKTGVLAVEINLGSPVVALNSTDDWVTAVSSNGNVYGDKATVGSPETAWEYTATAGIGVEPAVVDGVVYLAGDDQTIRAFTIPGNAIP